jgi:uncharacterized protein YfkK (UPF0435 family)
MLVLFPVNKFIKHVSEIVRKVNHGFLIIDVTGKFDSDTYERTMSQFKTTVPLDQIAPTSAIFNAYKDKFLGKTDEDILNELFSSYDYLRGINSILMHQAKYPDINIFIVYDKKLYKQYGKKLRNNIQSHALEQKIVFLWEEVDKKFKVLKEPLQMADDLKDKSYAKLREIYKRRMKIMKSAEVDDAISGKKNKKKKKEEHFTRKSFMKYLEGV